MKGHTNFNKYPFIYYSQNLSGSFKYVNQNNRHLYIWFQISLQLTKHTANIVHVRGYSDVLLDDANLLVDAAYGFEAATQFNTASLNEEALKHADALDDLASNFTTINKANWQYISFKGLFRCHPFCILL